MVDSARSFSGFANHQGTGFRGQIRCRNMKLFLSAEKSKVRPSPQELQQLGWCHPGVSSQASRIELRNLHEQQHATHTASTPGAIQNGLVDTLRVPWRRDNLSREVVA